MAPSTSTRPGETRMTDEVRARIDQALRARPVEDLPSGSARALYELLLAHGFDRTDVLELAGSLVDLVAGDVRHDAPGNV